MIYERFKMCFAFEGATDLVSVMLNIHIKLFTLLAIMSRGHLKKLVDKYWLHLVENEWWQEAVRDGIFVETNISMPWKRFRVDRASNWQNWKRHFRNARKRYRVQGIL
jgi:hypothetical protein